MVELLRETLKNMKDKIMIWETSLCCQTICSLHFNQVSEMKHFFVKFFQKEHF